MFTIEILDAGWDNPQYFQGYSLEDNQFTVSLFDLDSIEEEIISALPIDFERIDTSLIKINLSEITRHNLEADKNFILSDIVLVNDCSEEEAEEKFDCTLFLHCEIKTVVKEAEDYLKEMIGQSQINHNKTYRRLNSNNDTWDYYDCYALSLTGYSDYSGSSVERSNCRIFEEEDFSFISVNTEGIYSSRWLEIIMEKDTLEAIEKSPLQWFEFMEMLNSLTDYPCLNNEAMSEIELELQNESWENCYCSDFSSLLVKLVEKEIEEETGKVFSKFRINKLEKLIDKIEEASSEKMREVCEKAMEKANIYWVEETGSNMYLDLDRIFQEIEIKPTWVNGRNFFTRLFYSYKYSVVLTEE